MPTRLRSRLPTLAFPAIALACAIAVLIALPSRGAGEPTRAVKHPRAKIHRVKHKAKHKPKRKRHHRKRRIHRITLGERAVRVIGEQGASRGGAGGVQHPVVAAVQPRT